MDTGGLVGNLYEVLGVTKDASSTAIRKAYLTLAVQLHPDKNANDPKAKDRFQTLQKVYSILSDPEKRTVYDRTGSIEASEELGGDQFKDLYDYYRAMHAPVTEEAIDDFATSYQGSEEEKVDVLSYYQKFKGDMNQVFQWVILSDPDVDSIRFMEYIDEAIKNGKVSRYQPYTKWTRKVSKSKSKSKLTTMGNDRKRKNTESKRSRAEEREIEALMVKREGAFHGMLSAMASKYGVKPLSKSEEPSEEEFEAARKRIEQRKSKK